jgi:5'-3' exonuclease
VPNRLHVIDGTFELYRAHFSKRPEHTSPEGLEVKATVGLVGSVLSLLHEAAEAVTHVAIAFDNPIRSFRNDLFGGYKSDEGVPPELHAQFDLAERAMAAIGVVVWSMDRFEADDALATAATRFRDDFAQIRLLTPDKDLGQCLQGTRIVQIDRIRGREIDESAMRTQRGVSPQSIPDLLALVGDDADGIPGLPGIGEKTAAKLLGLYVHLEQIPDDFGQWKVEVRGAKTIAATLRSHREEALLYRRLATLVTDVPLRESMGELLWSGVPAAEFEAWCRELGVTGLRDRHLRFRANEGT